MERLPTLDFAIGTLAGQQIRGWRGGEGGRSEGEAENGSEEFHGMDLSC
jgi:hypothetical protein